MEVLERRVLELERELVRRDVMIRQLRAEVDKCHQVLNHHQLRPPQSSTGAADLSPPPKDSVMAQIAPWRVAAGGPKDQLDLPRFKRLAISAEPLLPRALERGATVDEVLRQTSLAPYMKRQKPKSAQ